MRGRRTGINVPAGTLVPTLPVLSCPIASSSLLDRRHNRLRTPCSSGWVVEWSCEQESWKGRYSTQRTKPGGSNHTRPESTDYHPHQHKPPSPPPSLLPLTVDPTVTILLAPIPCTALPCSCRHPPPAFRREHCQLCHNGDATTEEEKMIVFKMYIASAATSGNECGSSGSSGPQQGRGAFTQSLDGGWVGCSASASASAVPQRNTTLIPPTSTWSRCTWSQPWCPPTPRAWPTHPAAADAQQSESPCL
ncbi:hypothetical protein TcWFU_003474 [Taenia crassiceps]|uniref:Uncharacterized protein n=1 Tax=Taenia crassiceps TaxID=6207 RepID=A0ABR4Q128_9CEST